MNKQDFLDQLNRGEAVQGGSMHPAPIVIGNNVWIGAVVNQLIPLTSKQYN